MEASERETRYFYYPDRECHWCIEGHLTVFANMPGVGVMIGVGVAPVQWFLKIEQGADPHNGFI